MSRLGFTLLVVLCACAPRWKVAPHDTLFQRANERIVDEPAPRAPPSDWWDAARASSVRPLGQSLSPATYLETLVGGREALDVNAFGEVPASSWFVPRIGRGLDPAEMARGRGSYPPPAPGTLMVLSGKPSGATPGLVVRDSRDVVWYVKFDPPGFPELATGAEMVASRVLEAAGYWVPQTHLLDLDLERIDLDPGAVTWNKYGSEIPLSGEGLANLLVLLNPNADGRVRAVFSRRVEGEHLGPFSWQGVDSTDGNDRIPHERRRSLRALWVFFAWLNNTDAKASNTLDSFVPVHGRQGIVRHYLIDLGDSLGSAGNRVKYRHQGYEPYFDWGESGRRLVSLGFRYPYWLGLEPMASLSIGPFQSTHFDPAKWSPTYPNPAFEQATADDTFWGAALLARMNREHIGAAVDAAEYRESWVHNRIVATLGERQKKLLEHAFRGYTALDAPRMEGSVLTLTDLRREAHLPAAAPFQLEVYWSSSDVVVHRARSNQARVDLSDAIQQARELDGFDDDPFLTVALRRGESGETRVHLRVVSDQVIPVGLERKRRAIAQDTVH